jgi:1-acyl-sn-glycerol-3-phosphate acyltransferase
LLKTGYFIYANHVSSFDVASMIIFGLPRRIDFVGYSDPLTMPFVRRIIRPLGFLPLPTNPLDLVKFQEVLEYYTVKNNEAVVLFPEAHIWPQYTGIRDFKRSSFRYPAKFNRPILPIFFARRPKRGIYRLKRKNPVSVYIGDFIYPKDELSMKENEKYLGDECYKWMKNISETVPMDSTIDYVYIDKKFNPNYDIKE